MLKKLKKNLKINTNNENKINANNEDKINSNYIFNDFHYNFKNKNLKQDLEQYIKVPSENNIN